jgi:flagellar motor switch/type III secretory pathway protein FliN
MATALAVPQPKPTDVSDKGWEEAGWLPCRLNAEIPVRGFAVSDLLSIEIGSVVDAGITSGSDVCVYVNGARVGYGKLDVAAGHLAVRMTELV